MIRITCSSCQKPLSLDETKLPMREVGFPCPVCKAKLTVDRSKLEAAGDAAPAQAPAAAPPPQPQPQPQQQQSAPPPVEDDHADEFGAKALIAGNDSAVLRQAAKLIGFLPVHHADPLKARDFFNQELPQVVFLNPVQMTQPPLESLGPLLSVMPSERRKTFFVLFADNLRTLDGNAAFLYGVNLVVATKDIPQFPQIYREAHAAHERLYAAMHAVMREKQLA
jgi:uncharacterized protein YbaR (Trm112 family)